MLTYDWRLVIRTKDNHFNYYNWTFSLIGYVAMRREHFRDVVSSLQLKYTVYHRRNVEFYIRIICYKMDEKCLF